ncbi:polysaccharide biosynthesis protein [Maritalea porphyrae]|uniref:polysaccharide biosynthesis protein n=1 Tax=Maritalea porphyrae TaxID=880732 RepID=UPI0022AEDB0A|nr:nucleoside-diphosphate sugar epimerase/dehydratase [Maritalea porphyrae]MCZ4271540.1 nucleoside-diphosphate sugar epimerase/dehydratase [Maritalea porphyrae]
MRQWLRKFAMAMPRAQKRLIFLCFDFITLLGIVWLSYSLRLGQLFEPSLKQLMVMVAAPIVAIPIFIRLGIYRAVIRYLPDRAIWTILFAVGIATVAWVFIAFATEMTGGDGVPRSVPILYFAFSVLVIGGSRFLAKAIVVGSSGSSLSKDAVLIYGAGDAGSQLCSAMIAQGHRYVAGFVDDDKTIWGTEVVGVRVHSPERIDSLISDYGVKEIILSIPTLSANKRREIVDGLSKHNVKIRTLPLLSDLVEGKYLINQIRVIDIDELLGRSSVPAQPDLLESALQDKTVLITGAGGSIGAELCKLAIKWKPKKIVLFEANEFALYTIQQTLLERGYKDIVSVLSSIENRSTLREVIEKNDVEVVFHAAAHKHVPLLEENVIEGVRNNVMGTRAVAEVAAEEGVERVILISSDKAVRPTNVMGATKRWAEEIIRHQSNLAEERGTGQVFASVRFGNVLGSNGSVVPKFKAQIERGGPITLTDPAMTRYFMSIHEAAELIVQASSLATGGDIFVLEMGKPVPITELARNMVQLAGLSVRDGANPNGDIEIVQTGIRPGEKLFEELFYDEGSVSVTSHSKIMRAKTKSQNSSNKLPAELEKLEAVLAKKDEDAVRKILFGFVENRTD